MTIPNYGEHATEQTAPVDILQRLEKLAREQLAAQVEFEKAKTALEEAKAALALIQEKKIPALMEEARMLSFRTESGLVIEIEDKVHASLPKDPAKKEKALAWLRANNKAGLIKHFLQGYIGRGVSVEGVEAAVKQLESQGLTVEEKHVVEHQSLSAFVREQLKQGKSVPLETLGAYRQRIAHLSRPDGAD